MSCHTSGDLSLHLLLVLVLVLLLWLRVLSSPWPWHLCCPSSFPTTCWAVVQLVQLVQLGSQESLLSFVVGRVG